MRRTILLADDSPTIQRLVTQTFSGSEFDVVSVSNGEAAIRKFEDIRPQVVLADIYMPARDGYEVCAHVRRHATLSQTPVILLVGALETFDADLAQRSGADAHIKKPFEPSALVELVQTILEKPRETAVAAAAAASGATVESAVPESTAPAATDLLGLEALFPDEAKVASSSAAAGLSDSDVDRIADRALAKLSAGMVEKVAWDIVPDIVEKTLREELKRRT